MNPMHHRCDQCEQSATCHQVEIKEGVKTVRHLCDKHAAQAGMGASGVPAELLALLGQVVADALPKAAKTGAGGKSLAVPELSCPGCGQTLRDFQATHLLGCPECYATFEAMLAGLLERSQGSTHHVGKIPAKTAGAHRAHHLAMLTRMRRRLELAVEAEDYLLAARLRDEIRQMEANDASAASGARPGPGDGGEVGP